MRTRQYRYFMGDFETTVYQGQVRTEVWASAVVELNTDDVKIMHSIDETYEYLCDLNDNIIIYYHNLKFDGNFWLSYLMFDLQYKQAYTQLTAEPFTCEWLSEREMPNNSYKYSISNMGQWYSITIKHNNKIIEIRDSLKLLPFSVKRIGDSFGTKHKKLEMEYEGFRYAGCEITPEEQTYIANDVLVVKEALEIMFQEGHKKLTIGSCCLEEYKRTEPDYDTFFPNLYELEIDENQYGYKTAGDYIHKSYRGGWCYLCKGKENKLYHNGTTADVNSLYPSVMSSESGNKYPVGRPHFWVGDIPNYVKADDKFFFVRIKTRFYLKPGKLPFIQLKHNVMYVGTECLETSDVCIDGKYYTSYTGLDGEYHDTRIEMVMTEADFKLFTEHYYVADFEVLDGCWFAAETGIFDRYMTKYKNIKQTSKGARRELAKLFLNNLYGKMASSMNSSFKVAVKKDKDTLTFVEVKENKKKPGYIPVGSAITSYARCFTIRAAQQNYHGADEPGFIYADTDSIHCDLAPQEIQGIRVHPTDFCAWKLEAQWDEGFFSRQKTYIEHVIAEDEKPIEHPYYNVKCAGMPANCKDLFMKSMSGFVLDGRPLTEEQQKEVEKMSDDYKEFLKTERTIEDFKEGLVVPGKLMPKRIPGGVVLKSSTYEMR